MRRERYNNLALSRRSPKLAKDLYLVVAHYFRDVQEMLETLWISDVHYFRYFVRGNYLSDNTLHSLVVYIVLEITKVFSLFK